MITALSGNEPRIVRIVCHIVLTTTVYIGSNKSVLGGSETAAVSGRGLEVESNKNIIIRGLRFCCPIATDGLLLNRATHVWIDHNEFHADLDHDKDYYDELFSCKNGADFITVSWNKFHSHWKALLIGNSDRNGHIDTGTLHITFHHNYFVNLNSRVPSLRFGVGHIYNNYYENIFETGINSRMGAQVLVESNVFRNSSVPIATDLYSPENGYAVERNNDFGGAEFVISHNGSFTNPPYAYRLTRLSKIPVLVKQNAGRTIIF